MVLANLLSLCRLLLAPVVVWSLHREGAGLTTWVLLLAGGLTDLLDGIAARHLGHVSRTGKVLDPVADKVFIGAVCAGLVAWHDFPLWLLSMQLVRDSVIIAAGALLLRSRRLVIGASHLGKAATVIMGGTILAFLLPVPPAWRQNLALAAGLLLILSSAGYGARLWRIVRDDRGAS